MSSNMSMMTDADRLKQEYEEKYRALIDATEAEIAELETKIEAYDAFHTAIDEMFQELYGANLGELFVISSIPREHRHIFDTALEALGALNEAL